MVLVKLIFFFIISIIISVFLLAGATIAHENDIILDCKLTELFDKDRDFKSKVNFESIVTIKFEYNYGNENIIIFDNTKLMGKTFQGKKSEHNFTGHYIGKYPVDTKILIDRSNGFFMREGFKNNGDSFYEYTGKCKKIERLF